MIEFPALIVSIAAIAAAVIGRIVSQWLQRTKDFKIVIAKGDQKLSIHATGSSEEDINKLIEAYLNQPTTSKDNTSLGSSSPKHD
jgi:hypothetical protein